VHNLAAFGAFTVIIQATIVYCASAQHSSSLIFFSYDDRRQFVVAYNRLVSYLWPRL